MPKHAVIAPGLFEFCSSPPLFIYPPTPFDYEIRQHMILVEIYFPINYFACQNFSTPPPTIQKFSEKASIRGTWPDSYTRALVVLIG
jgi:hypothetical protein